jgi:fructose-bisphosphate aldolase class II
MAARGAARQAGAMPVATPQQYLEALDAAAAGGYALPAVNVTSSQTLHAVLRGLAEAEADGIVQVTTGGASYLAGGRPGAAHRGAAALASFAHEVAGAYPTLVALHTDHCPADQADGFLGPLLERSARRRAAGRPPLFNSHMFDGSMLALEDNLRRSAGWLSRAREAGMLLEIEVGAVGGEEDGLRGAALGSDHLYTTTADLLRTAEVLGTGERGRYLLAATFGNVHGVYAPGNVRLRPEILGEGQAALDAVRPGARFSYVFHGASGTPPELLREAIGHGVVKVNLDTEMQHAFSGAVADHVAGAADAMRVLDGGPESKRAFDPRTWGEKAQAAMAARVGRACETLGAAGRTLGRSTVG